MKDHIIILKADEIRLLNELLKTPKPIGQDLTELEREIRISITTKLNASS